MFRQPHIEDTWHNCENGAKKAASLSSKEEKKKFSQLYCYLLSPSLIVTFYYRRSVLITKRFIRPKTLYAEITEQLARKVVTYDINHLFREKQVVTSGQILGTSGPNGT
eukprot:scaffold6501_cov109-Skeletonema_marinoi.AAC.3